LLDESTDITKLVPPKIAIFLAQHDYLKQLLQNNKDFSFSLDKLYQVIKKELGVFLAKKYNFENPADTIAKILGEKPGKSEAEVEVSKPSLALDNASIKSGSSKWFSRENLSERLQSYMKVLL